MFLVHPDAQDAIARIVTPRPSPWQVIAVIQTVERRDTFAASLHMLTRELGGRLRRAITDVPALYRVAVTRSYSATRSCSSVGAGGRGTTAGPGSVNGKCVTTSSRIVPGVSQPGPT